MSFLGGWHYYFHKSSKSTSFMPFHIFTGLFINISPGRKTCSCWTLAGCGQLTKAGWSSTSLPPATCGWWAQSTTWACRSAWKPAAVRMHSTSSIHIHIYSVSMWLFITYQLHHFKKCRVFWIRAEHQLQRSRPHRSQWSIGEAAFHGGVLQN